MQMQLPLFPVETKLLSATWGVFEKDGFVYYLHNGSPVHVHQKEDINTYRYVTASLIVNHSCSASSLSKVFGVGVRNFERYAKRLRDLGPEGFFKPNDIRGQSHKMTPDKLKIAQECLDKGYSQMKTAKTIGVNEASIRYHISKGTLKKKIQETPQLKSPESRNNEDVAASEVFGIGATRIEERMLASKGKLSKTPVEFIASEGVEFAGVLFLLPSLLNTGLLSYKNHYNDLSGYYDLDTIILTLAFMYLCRIKNVEKLKHHNPGEFGKLLGLDRIPEARNLRAKLSMIYEQKKAQQWNRELASIWVESEENVFYYIDGHVKVYNGYKANLGKKHVARLKLCLPGMTEFWVNNSKGMPYFVVTGEVNEKLQEVIEKKIIPELKEHVALEITKEQLESDPDLPRFTLVFDREAYSPEFFSRLWKEHRIAIITYRKNVKDTWEQEDFSKHTIKIDGNEVEMELGEKNVELNDVTLREIRKKNSSSHQTSIITTNKKLTTIIIAIKMFARWTQENFFKYLRQEYDLDRIVHYVLNEIDSDIKVVNPLHRKLSNQIKKVREKIARRKARLYQLVHENIEDDPDKTEKNLDNQSKTSEELKDLETEEKELLGQRKEQSYKITIKEMEDEIKYNKLDLESKLLQNIIKMICYRAETSFSILLASNYKKKVNEMRALTKSLINSKANIKPDYNNQRLTIELYSQSNPRDNKMVREICQVLNESQTKFPGTDLKLIYKFASDNFTRDQEF